jgi:uncharacterized hydrophobic protein (TIGR00271 family)
VPFSGLLKDFDLLHLGDVEKRSIYDEIRNSNQMQPGYLLLVLTACLIALLGLLINSTAVIIGAMLISPLMNPFLSAALALTLGDWALGRQALRTTLLSILVAIAICVMTLYISPLKDTTAEILARTKPNLMDLLIAFFAGIAGTYTLLVRKGSTTIPGVAIATAVMPPLCVTGFGIYHRSWPIASGAFALFATNLVAIIVSAALMFTIAHFRVADSYTEEKSRFGVRKRLAASFCLLGIISVPLFYSLVRAVKESRSRGQIESIMRRELESNREAQLEQGWRFEPDGNGKMILSAVLRTPAYLNSDEIRSAEKRLEETIGTPITLRISQLKIHQGTAIDSSISSLTSDIAPKIAPPPLKQRPTDYIHELQSWADPLIKEIGILFGVHIENYKIEVPSSDAAPSILATLRSDEPLLEGTMEAATRVVKERLAREGFKIDENEKILKLHILPKSDPYSIIRFTPKSFKIVEGSEKDFQRSARYLTSSRILKLVLLFPADPEVVQEKLQRRRKQVVIEALQANGWAVSYPVSEERSDKLSFDEIGIRFIRQEQ